MKNLHLRRFRAAIVGFALVFALTTAISLRALAAGEASPELIQPAALVKLLSAPASSKPLLIQVGFRTLYEQAHIPGSEYIGPTSEAAGLQALHKRVQALPRNRLIVLYCGCCPWSHCPNVRPAYKELRDMGFSNVKVLYLANNFGTDWVNKGYPATRGK